MLLVFLLLQHGPLVKRKREWVSSILVNKRFMFRLPENFAKADEKKPEKEPTPQKVPLRTLVSKSKT